MKHSKIYELIGYILMALALMMACTGCVNKVYDRETLTVDPNGVWHYERIHGGITGIATDTEFESFEIVSRSGKVKVVKAAENQDSIKVVVPPYFGGETKE